MGAATCVVVSIGWRLFERMSKKKTTTNTHVSSALGAPLHSISNAMCSFFSRCLTWLNRDFHSINLPFHIWNIRLNLMCARCRFVAFIIILSVYVCVQWIMALLQRAKWLARPFTYFTQQLKLHNSFDEMFFFFQIDFKWASIQNSFDWMHKYTGRKKNKAWKTPRF